MRTSLLLLLALGSSATHAQDWELFPLGQRSFFPGTAATVDMYIMDSIRTETDHETLFFNSRPQLGGAEHCTEAVLGSDQWIYLYDQNPFPLDTLQRRGDTVFYFHQGSTAPFFFLPKAGTGESWTVVSTHSANTYQEITITCVSIAEESFWGVTDSVKTFSLSANGSSPGQLPISNFIMRLSRTYGFLEFVPFRQFLVHPPSVSFTSRTCMGIDRSGASLGFNLPGLLEHFVLAPGDLRLWRQQFHPIMQPTVTKYLLDSITEASITSDTVRLTYLRWVEQPGIGITGPTQKVEMYTNAGSSAILACPKDWVAAGSDGIWNTIDWTGVWVKQDITTTIDGLTGDTVVSTHLYSAAYAVDTVTCAFMAPTDLGLSRTLRTGIGVTEICEGSSQQNQMDCTTLIGYRVGGLVSGPISLGIHDADLGREAPTLFPNPVLDHLTIQGLPNGQRSSYAVFDALGSIVDQGTLTTDRLRVETLPAGSYVLWINSGDETHHARFVRQ